MSWKDRSKVVDPNAPPPKAGWRERSTPAATPPPQPEAEDWLTGLVQRAKAVGLGAAQGATLNFGDEAGGLIQALGEKYLPEANPKIFGLEIPVGGGGGEQAQAKSLMDLYRGNRDAFRRENAAAEQAHGGYYLGGNLLGGLAYAPLLPGLGQGKTLGQLMLQGMGVGAATGAAGGLGSSYADLTRGQYGRAALDTGVGGLLGGAIGTAAPPIAAGVGWAARNVGAPLISILRGGYVKPTAEAQRLAGKGVDLTLGQMDPTSGFGLAEELAASKVGGGSVAAARERSASSTRDALLELAGAKGAKPPTRGAPVGQQLEELKAGFNQLYDDALEGAKLNPEQYLGQGKWRGLLTDETIQGSARTKGAFELAAGARDIDASPGVRRRALSWLTDKAQTLLPRKSGPNAGMVDAKSVHSLRTQLRDKLRSLGQEGEDRQLREIYGRAEEFVTELLEGQLPPERTGMLRAADAAYRNLKSVEDAAKRAFVQNEEFTPAQLLQAIRNKGATPELEATARDAQAVLAARYPPTGIQVAANESIPLLNKLGPAWAALTNASPGLRAHALKQTFAPGLPAKALTATGRALEGAALQPRGTSTASRFLYDLLHPGGAQDDALTSAVSP